MEVDDAAGPDVEIETERAVTTASKHEMTEMRDIIV